MVNVLVLTGYGINCDGETRYAFERAGANAEIVHINDLIGGFKKLDDYQILAFPGGFSYGDDTGSGKALANRIRNNIWDELLSFVRSDKLIIGICNGFQVMANLGLLPALDGKYGSPQVALRHNETARYECRWVDLKVQSGKSIFTRGIDTLHIPVAHGEGNFYADEKVLKSLNEKGLVVFRYTLPNGERAEGRFPHNPNGSLEDIAGICDETGRLLGMMPHPERYIDFINRDDWTFLKEQYKRAGKELPKEGEGMKIFRNAVEYFS